MYIKILRISYFALPPAIRCRDTLSTTLRSSAGTVRQACGNSTSDASTSLRSWSSRSSPASP
eukprot:234732-Hanusia_phi.AAC.1